MIRVLGDDFSDVSSMNAVRMPPNNRISDQTDGTQMERVGHISGVSGLSGNNDDTEFMRVPNPRGGGDGMSESDMVRMDGVTDSDANDVEFLRVKNQTDDEGLPNRLSAMDKVEDQKKGEKMRDRYNT